MKCDPTVYRMAWIILNAFIGYFSLPLEIGIKCPSLNFCSGWAQWEIRLFSASASQTTICWGRASKSIVLFETFAYLFYFPSSLDWEKKWGISIQNKVKKEEWKAEKQLPGCSCTSSGYYKAPSLCDLHPNTCFCAEVQLFRILGFLISQEIFMNKRPGLL